MFDDFNVMLVRYHGSPVKICVELYILESLNWVDVRLAKSQICIGVLYMTTPVWSHSCTGMVWFWDLILALEEYGEYDYFFLGFRCLLSRLTVYPWIILQCYPKTFGYVMYWNIYVIIKYNFDFV